MNALFLAVLGGLGCLLAWPPAPLERLSRAPSPRRRLAGTALVQRLAVTCACTLLAALFLPDWPLAPLAAAVAGWFIAPRVKLPRGADPCLAQLPLTLDLLAVCLESGAPTVAAVRAVAEASPPATRELLQRVLAHLEVGCGAGRAWAELRNHPAWAGAAREFIRSTRSGSSLAEALRGLAAEARHDAREEQLRRARTAGVKAVGPLMVCFLPAFIAVGIVPIIAGLLRGFLG